MVVTHSVRTYRDVLENMVGNHRRTLRRCGRSLFVLEANSRNGAIYV